MSCSWENTYYISHPEPSILDTKWQNRDINVVKQAKIPKFSKLDDIGTHLDSLNYSLMMH